MLIRLPSRLVCALPSSSTCGLTPLAAAQYPSLPPSASPYRNPCRYQNHVLRRRLFSTSTHRTDDTRSHYDVLQLNPSCTQKELKRQFYALSKSTHPDLHPDDPNASNRFTQVSEAYSVLADPDKRSKYDRDELPRFQRGWRSHGRHGGDPGSYAGSRPASGLSRRRGAFRGPPPSFYAHGGGGGGPRPSNDSASSSSTSSSSSSTTGQPDPFDTYADFDPSSTFRTQTVEDIRRDRRRAQQRQMASDELEAQRDSDFWARFVIVSGVVLLGITVGTLVAGGESKKGGLVGADGRRRRGGEGNGTKRT